MSSRKIRTEPYVVMVNKILKLLRLTGGKLVSLSFYDGETPVLLHFSALKFA